MSAKDCCFRNGDDWFRYRSAAIIVEDGAALFIGCSTLDYLYTVGGGVRLGEKAVDCVRREALEETGIPYEVDRLAIVCENFFKGHGGKMEGLNAHCLEFYFLMKSRGSRQLHGTSLNWFGDEEKRIWVPIARMDEYPIEPSFLKAALPEIIAGSGLLHVVAEDGRRVSPLLSPPRGSGV